jgi:GMP synthase (glutamine-hydrolysing)
MSICIIDLGGQYAQLIARRIRELNIYSFIANSKITLEELENKGVKGIILSGGPNSVYADNAPSINKDVIDSDIPIFGICYGSQLLAQHFGGKVENLGKGEYGRTEVNICANGDLLRNFNTTNVWMSHGDTIIDPPQGSTVLVNTTNTPVAGFENAEKGIYGVQFHPEVTHTAEGANILKNFCIKIAKCSQDWDAQNIIDHAVEKIQEQTKGEKVICALSGGVDSAVAAALGYKAIGEDLTCVFVDTGLLREGEAKRVVDAFTKEFKVDLVHIDAKEKFFTALAGVIEPEEKRKIIGELFIRIFEEEAKDYKYLMQGTLYPDVIESGSDTAATIKTHHNVGLPEDIQFEVIEPLNMLFKDEVRSIGETLGLAHDMVHRQPFPGPGLAVRIIGEVNYENVRMVREADHIARRILEQHPINKEIWQAFTVLADIKSVGVMGDGRTYARPIILRAVTSEDAMTADFARIPYDVLEEIMNQIVNNVDGVNRVVYDITSKPPGTIEWE